MSPETPPPASPEREPSRSGGQAPFGPGAAASLERSLAQLGDPDDALRILRGIEEAGASFAAYLLLPDTNLTSEDILDRSTTATPTPGSTSLTSAATSSRGSAGSTP